MARILDGVQAIAGEIIKQKDYLNTLDKAISDGDHGVNMSRGFTSIADRINSIEEPNLKNVLEFMGRTMLTTVGGAAGPLYGNGFTAAAAICPENVYVTPEIVYSLMTTAVEAIKKRGRSAQGDKTMLDVIIPVAECFSPEHAEGKTLNQCLEAAVKAAKNGVIYTSTIPARRGKASYIGDASIGHEDPGAVSAMIMVKALYDFLRR